MVYIASATRASEATRQSETEASEAES